MISRDTVYLNVELRTDRQKDGRTKLSLHIRRLYGVAHYKTTSVSQATKNYRNVGFISGWLQVTNTDIIGGNC